MSWIHYHRTNTFLWLMQVPPITKEESLYHAPTPRFQHRTSYTIPPSTRIFGSSSALEQSPSNFGAAKSRVRRQLVWWQLRWWQEHARCGWLCQCQSYALQEAGRLPAAVPKKKLGKHKSTKRVAAAAADEPFDSTSALVLRTFVASYKSMMGKLHNSGTNINKSIFFSIDHWRIVGCCI
jgi:hypothetical protein